jgi:hypothetical protein
LTQLAPSAACAGAPASAKALNAMMAGSNGKVLRNVLIMMRSPCFKRNSLAIPGCMIPEKLVVSQYAIS